MSLDINIKNQLSQFLELIEKPVILSLSLAEDKTSVELRDFVTEVASMTDMIKVDEKSLDLKPSFSISREDYDPGIVFAGIPLGHEFESFVLALLQVGGRAPKISDQQIEAIKSIDRELKFETIVSLSCHNCPEVVQSLNIMSLLNPKISHTMIEGGSFQKLVEDRGVMAVPTVFLGGEIFLSGRNNLDQILNKLIGPKTSKSFDDIEDFDVLIVGGGPAGASAAIYTARKGLRTGLVADEFGGQVKETLGIENILGIPYTEGPKYMNQVKEHVEEYGVEIIQGVMVKKLSPNREGGKVSIELDNGAQIKTKTLIIASGARWKLIGIPGEKELRNKGVAYCTHCDGPLFKDKTVAVIGGGNSGVEAAIDLASMVKEVKVFEFLPELKADQVLQEKLKSLDNVKITTNVQTTKIGGDNKVESITYIDRESNQVIEEDIQGCFIQVGLVPNTEWLKGVVEMNQRGEIIVDKEGKTNLEGVYAAGDCTDVAFKQIIISAGSGATAALGAFNYLIRN